MAEQAFVEGDQAPRVKDPEELDLQERVPSRLVEEHGDDALRQPVHAELESATLSSQPFNEAALDEGLMVRELLKKGRLKNPTLTEKGAPLQLLEDRHLSLLLEATQNTTLRYQLRGMVKPLSPEPKSQNASTKPVADVSISQEVPQSEESAGSADGARSILPASVSITDGTVRSSHPPVNAKVSALAFSPSQLQVERVNSRLTELNDKEECQMPRGNEVCRKLSNVTQKATGVSDGAASTEATMTPQPREHDPLSSPSLLEQAATADLLSEGASDDRIREMPVLEVLDKCELADMSTYIRRARRRRCYGTDVGSCSSDSDRSFVKLDFSTLPTEASEMVTDRRCGREACNEPTRADESTTSTSSWYSFPSAASRRSSGLRAAASESAGSWTPRRQRLSVSPDVPEESMKASSLIRFFESRN